MVDAVKKFRDGAAAIGTVQGAAEAGLQHSRQAELRSFEGVVPKGCEWRNLDTAGSQAQRAAAAFPREAVSA